MKKTTRLSLTRNRIWKIILLICYLFIISGGFNTGFSKFYMATPFMLVASLISITAIGDSRVKAITHLLILLSILFNVTLTKNPIVFPILNNGYIEILSDGYHVSYSDGSGGFRAKINSKEWRENKVSIIELKKGEKYQVVGINVGHPDFSTKVNLQTEIGQFSQQDYQGSLYDSSEAVILPNKKVHAEWTNALSVLMLWPVLIIGSFPLGIIIFGILIVILFAIIRKLPKSEDHNKSIQPTAKASAD